MKTIVIDVMVEHGARYYGELRVQCSEIFDIRKADLVKALYTRFPTLKYRTDVVLEGNRIIKQ